MSKLLLRLSDASRSGVYRAARSDEILDAARGSALRIVRLDLTGISSKDALLERLAGVLEFPRWFGGNWDALEDCLTDLSWLPAGGYVLLIEGTADLSGDERGILADVLASAAAHWAQQGRPFFAVYLNGAASFPELYRGAK